VRLILGEFQAVRLAVEKGHQFVAWPVIFQLLCGVSTVHDDILARSERGSGRTKPEHRAGNFLRSADPAHWVLCRNRFLCIGLAFPEGPVEHFGLDWAGRDTVDADALLCEFQRSRLGEADHGELAGDVNRRAGKADVAANGGVIDDGTTTGAKHGRDFMLHRQQHAADVDVGDLMVVLDRLLGGEQAELALAAGVVERDVQSAEGIDGLLDERDDVILPGDIGPHEQGASAGRSDLPGDLLSLGNAAAREDYISTFFSKRESGGFTDAGDASGDKDSLVFEDFHNWA
jgi:hypothetical protein